MRLTPTAAAAAAAAVVGALLAPTAATAQPDAAPLDDPSRPVGAARFAPSADDLLPRTLAGAAALDVLERRGALDDAARHNGFTVTRLERLLTDDAARMTPGGTFYYAEPAPATATADPTATVARGPYPQSQTFQLHSKPGSQRTLYLDFDGGTVSNTAWNTSRGGELPNGSHPGWDPAGNGAATWSALEHDLVQSIWQRVAEDFAPFDVDVTTQDPGAAAITRNGAADLQYGTRALVTPSDAALQALCDGECVGIAQLDVYAATSDHAAGQPAWVFPQGYGTDAKGIAETISHEVGHTFNLEHDSKGNTVYYAGHANWAPIMGNSDLRPVTQWSKGGYTGAQQSQDDLAEIAERTQGRRADEAGGTPATAAPVPTDGTPAYVTTRQDVDVYALGQCAGAVSVAVAVAPVSPNLDARVRLLDGAGAQVAAANPASGGSGDDATGMSATASASVTAGTYYAEVDGVGNGTVSSGYDDYASLGAYTLDVTGCVGEVTDVPSAPRELTAFADGEDSATVLWDSPLSDGGSAVTGFRVSVDGGTPTEVAADQRSATLTGLSAGTHEVAVRAVNANGAGAVATTTVTTGTPSVTAPGAVRDLAAAVTGTRVDIAWQVPASDGGSAVTGYRVTVSGLGSQDFDASVTSVFITDLPRGGAFTATVSALNEVGVGPARSVSFRVVGPPRAPRIGAAASGARGGAVTATARWSPPADNGGAAVTGYQVYAYEQGGRRRTLVSQTLGQATRSVSLRLPRGRFAFAVRARNSAGWGPVSARSRVVVAQ